MALARVRWFFGSRPMQTGQPQPMAGTPTLVPVPRRMSSPVMFRVWTCLGTGNVGTENKGTENSDKREAFEPAAAFGAARGGLSIVARQCDLCRGQNSPSASLGLAGLGTGKRP